MMKLLKKNPLYILLGILIIPILMYLLFKWVKGSFSKGVVYSELDTDGATITDLQAKSIAEGLYEAMYTYGTDEDRIYELLRGISPPDFSKIYNAFGIRPYNEFFGSWEISLFGLDFDLLQWLSSELNDSELRKLSSVTDGVLF
ncbi:conserved hypothetical protein [Tenacibaculum maritimum]|uniref:hypothetical protein n=2 Tax=Tenacibaculum maritimum TaxID=107401 RepID=UPI0012E6BB62|nr:hypothetical protein [Tenacibaculum maritimum]CAA0190314.1 conserved hypothetical protein [Tenacibaculum maritimum]